jgi:chromosomal replication initiation ATPase DnaA
MVGMMTQAERDEIVMNRSIAEFRRGLRRRTVQAEDRAAQRTVRLRGAVAPWETAKVASDVRREACEQMRTGQRREERQARPGVKAKLAWHLVQGQVALAQELVAAKVGITVAYMMGRSNERRRVSARRLVIGLVRRNVAVSLPELGEGWGMHHTSILHHEQVLTAELATYPGIREQFEVLEAQFQQALKERFGWVN